MCSPRRCHLFSSMCIPVPSLPRRSTTFTRDIRSDLSDNPLWCPLPDFCQSNTNPNILCPSCLDCTNGGFSCMNGGICIDETSMNSGGPENLPGQCDCPDGYAKRDCSVLCCSGHGMCDLSADLLPPLAHQFHNFRSRLNRICHGL